LLRPLWVVFNGPKILKVREGIRIDKGQRTKSSAPQFKDVFDFLDAGQTCQYGNVRGKSKRLRLTLREFPGELFPGDR